MVNKRKKYNAYDLCKDIAEASLSTSQIAAKHNLSERQINHIIAGESRPELKRIIDRLSRSRFREIQRVFRGRGRAAAQRLFQLIEGSIPIKRKNKKGEMIEVDEPVAPFVILQAIMGLLKYSAIAEDDYDDDVIPTIIRTPLRMPLQPKNPVADKTDSTAPRASQANSDGSNSK